MYIINTIPHGKFFVRYLRTRCFCIRNLTRSLRSLVRFLIRQQLVRKYRTPALSMKYSLYIGHQMFTNLALFILTFVNFLNLWFQPQNSRFEVRDRNSRTPWHAQWLSCCKNTSGWRPWYQERLVFKFATIYRRPTKKTETNLKADEEKQ